jgi:hypothetical protein
MSPFAGSSLPRMTDEDEEDRIRRLALEHNIPLSAARSLALGGPTQDTTLNARLLKKYGRLNYSEQRLILQLMDEFLQYKPHD